MSRPNVFALFLSGARTALRHWRVAVVLWLVLGASALLSWPTLAALTRGVDRSPFRDTVLRGWDSRAVASWLAAHGDGVADAIPALLTVALLAGGVQFLLTGGAIRVLSGSPGRATVRRLVVESADVCRPTLWALARFVLTLAAWWIVLVGVPVFAAVKARGAGAPPNGPLVTVATGWALAGTLAVFLRVALRFDLARVALALGEATTARAAYRMARRWLREGRARPLALLLGWLAGIVASQAALAQLLRGMNPATGAGTVLLAAVAQAGIVLATLARLALWGSLLAWRGAGAPEPAAAALPLRPDVGADTAAPAGGLP